MAMPVTSCPTCGHPLAEHIDLQLIRASLGLPRYERRLFERFAQQFGQWIETSELMDAVYFDDAEGGPATARSVMATLVFKLNPKLGTVGLRIEARTSGVRRLIKVAL